MVTNDYDYIKIAAVDNNSWFFIVQLAYVYRDSM